MRFLTNKNKRLLVTAICVARKRTNEREFWVHPINKLRPKLGDQVKLDVKHEKYPDRFKKETRFTPAQFDELLLMTEKALEKKAPRRDCIEPRVRLYVTLK